MESTGMGYLDLVVREYQDMQSDTILKKVYQLFLIF